MKKLLIVVDMQNDFIDGALGTPEAQAIVPNVVNKIKKWEGDVFCTRDTHLENYLSTREGKHLPVEHCIKDTDGHKLNSDVYAELCETRLKRTPFTVINKYTFGSTALPEIIRPIGYDYIELVGLCTDICVVSNAMILKAHFPEIDIAVDASCCAGVTLESHNAALTTMKMCQINVIGE